MTAEPLTLDTDPPDSAAVKLTASDVCDALHSRYNKPSQGREGEQYVCIEEARAGAGFKGNDGRCDFLAINTWQSRGMELIGHEVKVSMSDWKAELSKPKKAERFARFCRRWYVVVPNELAAKIKHEVPPLWGLLSVSPKGNVREVIAAPARKPEDVPAWWWVGWLAQIDRQHKRGMAQTIQRRMSEERIALREKVEADVEYRRRHAIEATEKLRENAQALRNATGIDLQHIWQFDFDKLRTAWALVRSGYDTENLTRMLRKAADSLDALQADLSEPDDSGESPTTAPVPIGPEDEA